jgi:hypothetical protein
MRVWKSCAARCLILTFVVDPTRSLNDLGQEAWEFVAIRGYGNENQALYVLKRPKP